jgi:protein-arginine kinase
VNEDSVLVVTADSYPFNLLLEYSNMENTGTSDEVIISDLNYIMSQLSNTDREALTTAIFTLLTEVEGAGL